MDALDLKVNVKEHPNGTVTAAMLVGSHENNRLWSGSFEMTAGQWATFRELLACGKLAMGDLANFKTEVITEDAQLW
jgi:hypothetical protein